MSVHAKKSIERECGLKGHVFMTGDPAAQWLSRSCQARYFCPTCFAAGQRPPKSWHQVGVAA